MTHKRPFVGVPAKEGEEVRKRLLDKGLLDVEYKVVVEDEVLYIPLCQEFTMKELRKIIEKEDIITGVRDFRSAVSGPKTLSEALADLFPSELLQLVPRAYDLIGDIAILEIPEQLTDYERLIGETFLRLHKSASTVLSKQSAISGVTRIREYNFLAGKRNTKTVHIEYGCKIAVDLAKAYFSPRLLEEHNRVADLVTDGEKVLDMFAGVGPFAIHIARRKKGEVIAIDINHDAIELLKESIGMNQLVGRISPVVADAHEYIPSTFDGDVDRVIMNHPTAAFEFIPEACHALKKNGVMHYYEFMGGENPESELENRLNQLIIDAGREVNQITEIRRVRDSAPHEYQMVADVVIS